MLRSLYGGGGGGGGYIISNIQYKLIYKAIPIQLKLTLFSPECKSVTTNGSDNRRNYIALLSVGSKMQAYMVMLNSFTISNVSLPIPNTCNCYYSMSGKWYVTLAILVSTISEKSNRSQKCKNTDCQSKKKCNLSHKETTVTWVSTQND